MTRGYGFEAPLLSNKGRVLEHLQKTSRVAEHTTGDNKTNVERMSSEAHETVSLRKDDNL